MNLSNTERTLRTIVGLLLLILVYTKKIRGWQAIIITIVSILQFVDAAFSYCIVYDILGLSTYKKVNH